MLATGQWSVLFAMTIISAVTSCSVLLSAHLELENPCLPFKVMFLFPPLARVTCMGWSVYKCGWGQIKSLGMDAFLTDYPWRGMGGEHFIEVDTLTAEWVTGDKEAGDRNPNADVCVTAQCKNRVISKDQITLFLKRAVKSHFILAIPPIKHIKKKSWCLKGVSINLST